MSKFFLGLVATFIALLLWPKEPGWKELAGLYLFMCIVSISLITLIHWVYQFIQSL